MHRPRRAARNCSTPRRRTALGRRTATHLAIAGAPLRRRAARVMVGAAAVGLAACGSDSAVEPLPYCDEPVASMRPSSLPSWSASVGAPVPFAEVASPFDDAFADAAARYDVPLDLLRAVGWVETRWQMVEGAEVLNRPAAFGVMALRGERLEDGARRAGVSVAAARHDAGANIRAAAALLDAYAGEAGIDRTRPAAWDVVLERYSGIGLPEGRVAYTRQVAAVRERGLVRLPDPVPAASAARTAGLATANRPGATAAAHGGATPPAHAWLATAAAGSAPNVIAADQEDCIPRPRAPGDGGPDYDDAVWRPSPNYDARAGDSTGVPHMVIVHTCEGAYSGCWSWLTSPVSQVSSHYVVDEVGGEISQLVREQDRAWHIAARYRCWLNEDNDCWLNDVQSNHFTVGIEHAGYASQSFFPATQIEASAALVCDISRDRDIPRDWQHILGHGRLQPENRTDPGEHWPWTSYMHRIQALCGETVIDDDDARNDADLAAVAVAGAWVDADTAPGYYGGGYRWASAADTDDAVTFRFRLDSAATRTVDARWTAGPNRSAAATFIVLDAAGDTLATVQVDQTAGHEAWHELGTFAFDAGWNAVVLLRRGGPGVVVADAVRVREWGEP